MKEETKDIMNALEDQGLKTKLTTPEDFETDYLLFLFDRMQELLIAGKLPDCKKYEAAALEYLQCTKESLYYYYFMGFVCGLNLMQFIEDAENEGENEEGGNK